MENSNVNEYGLSYDAEAFEKYYEEIQALLQADNIYDNNDNAFDHRRDDSWAPLLSPVISNIVLLVLAFTLIFIIPFVSQGLLRGVYLLKTILLGLSNGLVVVFPLLQHEALKYQTKAGDHSTPFRALLICVYLSEACAMFAATLSCVVMREIHICVTRKEVRQPEVGHWAKKIVACGVISFFIPALSFLQGQLKSFWWKAFFTTGNPVMALVALVSCISSTYMGVSAGAALWAAGKVSSGSHGGGGQRQKWHIYGILLAIVIAQWFQLIGDLVKAILVNAKSLHCPEGRLSDAEIQECIENSVTFQYLLLKLHRSVAGVLESVGFTCIMIGKKCLTDAA